MPASARRGGIKKGGSVIGPCRSLQEYLNGLAFKLAPREVEVVLDLHRSRNGFTALQLAELVYKCTYKEDQNCIRQHISKANMRCIRMEIPPIVVSVGSKEIGDRVYYLSDFLLSLPSDPKIQIIYTPRGRPKQLRIGNI